MKNGAVVAAVILFVCLSTPAWAEMYGFTVVENNSSIYDPGIMQFTVDVTDAGPVGSMNRVLFTFKNNGPITSSITQVYFDDGTLLGIADLIDKDQNSGDANVDFTQVGSAETPVLPGWENLDPDFITTAGFAAKADPSPSHNGIKVGESLGIIFNLQGTQTLEDTIRMLADGGLRIGLHVQGFLDGKSESYVNGPPVLPLPGAVLLGVLGLGAAGMKLRRWV